eukprot:NODE_5615_length_690_cov_2.698908_g4745_i0.p2 GENE.NODE_5615_length_690_cov_2.698908_g4745_i0~~NODE_5615_length_690_cov_2.698908_g4745_i0.p2  ORF type:complete len:86 (+),score=0.18 NODE_5615_length_690_cov_2.698908_g4745_i0:167-424(+)
MKEDRKSPMNPEVEDSCIFHPFAQALFFDLLLQKLTWLTHVRRLGFAVIFGGYLLGSDHRTVFAEHSVLHGRHHTRPLSEGSENA